MYQAKYTKSLSSQILSYLYSHFNINSNLIYNFNFYGVVNVFFYGHKTF